MTEFTIQGKPKGKDRPRFYKGHAYTPPETKKYEGLVRWAYHAANGYKYGGGVAIVIDAYFKPPARTTKAMLQKMLDCELRPKRKPDLDNVAKIIMDALNGIAYDDDSQVVELTVRKWFGLTDKVTVKIYDEGTLQ